MCNTWINYRPETAARANREREKNRKKNRLNVISLLNCITNRASPVRLAADGVLCKLLWSLKHFHFQLLQKKPASQESKTGRGTNSNDRVFLLLCFSFASSFTLQPQTANTNAFPRLFRQLHGNVLLLACGLQAAAIVPPANCLFARLSWRPGQVHLGCGCCPTPRQVPGLARFRSAPERSIETNREQRSGTKQMAAPDGSSRFGWSRPWNSTSRLWLVHAYGRHFSTSARRPPRRSFPQLIAYLHDFHDDLGKYI